jgi:hypothetical protein
LISNKNQGGFVVVLIKTLMTHTFKSLKAINEALKRGDITLDTTNLVMIDEFAEFTRKDFANIQAAPNKPRVKSYSCELFTKPRTPSV